ncbi:hypothetical protein NDU88_000193 [Pleurodeles waltl]|uniref:Uncharacterized protein n=1 Tax=Pleurodeles waltl TaxID=8319 RepID=A0AAV7SW79_PLEWA|nr:hypothetical protein NDU88_000193 [Pleurodeles waltl]
MTTGEHCRGRGDPRAELQRRRRWPQGRTAEAEMTPGSTAEAEMTPGSTAEEMTPGSTVEEMTPGSTAEEEMTPGEHRRGGRDDPRGALQKRGDDPREALR